MGVKGSRADGPRCIILLGTRGPEARRGSGLVFGRGETEDRDRISQWRETQDVSNLMHMPERSLPLGPRVKEPGENPNSFPPRLPGS